jgi:O-antigen/teichoic acid export membrane protein
MSRFRRMAHNVASSYASLIAAALLFLATVPVALHYLGADSGRFTLWLLMSTITGYLSLIDLGMSGSVARLLIDYKDRQAGGEYGSLIKTGWLVLLAQAAIILVAGIALAPVLAWMLKIDPELRLEFIWLLRWQSGSLALAFALRIFGHLLNAHQRSDIQNYGQVIGGGLNFVLMWVFFRAGHGVFSLAWATWITTLFSGLVCLAACQRLRLFPPPGTWGRISWERFRELFRFGQDMFLVALGTQLIMGSQILIIQRSLGEIAATLWGIGTRLFLMVSQVIWRISDTAGPTFSEMIVRGEREKLKARYREMVILTASLSGVCAVGLVLCNSLFVTVWTQGKFVWPALNDLGMALWMVILAVLHCHNSFVLVTKRIEFMRYVYFIEGLIFVGVALVSVQAGGFLAIIGSSLACSCLFSGAYGIWRIRRYFEISRREILLDWHVPMGRTILLCVFLAGATWLATLPFENPVLRLGALILVFGSGGLCIFLRYGLPQSFQQELSSRAPRITLPLLKRILTTH